MDDLVFLPVHSRFPENDKYGYGYVVVRNNSINYVRGSERVLKIMRKYRYEDAIIDERHRNNLIYVVKQIIERNLAYTVFTFMAAIVLSAKMSGYYMGIEEVLEIFGFRKSRENIMKVRKEYSKLLKRLEIKIDPSKYVTSLLYKIAYENNVDDERVVYIVLKMLKAIRERKGNIGYGKELKLVFYVVSRAFNFNVTLNRLVNGSSGGSKKLKSLGIGLKYIDVDSGEVVYDLKWKIKYRSWNARPLPRPFELCRTPVRMEINGTELKVYVKKIDCGKK